MQYKKLGNSELIVSQIALGTWGLGGGSVWSDKDSTAAEAERLLDACREQGINYIDTAPVYGTGESEELLGAALRGRRHDFILQSKCSLNWRGEGGNFHYSRDGYTVNNDTRPEAIRRDVEDSLRRMKTDYLDSVIVHYVCKSFPVADTVGALEDLLRAGKIRAYGLSNSQPADLEEYQSAPDRAQGVAVVQEFFSVLSPFHGRSYFPVCEKYNTTFQTYGVLEEGFLTGPAFLERSFAKTDIRSRIPWVGAEYHAGLRRAFEAWKPLCEAHGCSYAQLVEAWALAQFPNMSLLVGMRKPANVADTVRSLELRLSPEELALIEDSVKAIQVEVLDK
ncbi:MAG: aldo/keto reductase [Oscillospiraceae bacterium]|jgi:Predicted oxidoreductases (related to aryl-alcohol dehydrogenases)|nr:aldo/keto reductase [Oscillospiraceae bacterium]